MRLEELTPGAVIGGVSPGEAVTVVAVTWHGSSAVTLTYRDGAGRVAERLYLRDPEAWRAHLAEGNAKQARKRVGADVILRDTHGRILLVDPKYKPDWDLPGGMAEANEPPHEAVRRELKEELGLDLHVGDLLCVDWISPHGPWDDSLMFIFDAGSLTPEQIANIQLLDGELAEFRFCAEEELPRLLRSSLWRRAEAAIEALRTGRARYLQDGYPTR